MLLIKNYKLERALTLKELAPIPYFSIINVHLMGINVFAKFYRILLLPFKILKNKNVADRRMDNVKTVSPPHTQTQLRNNKSDKE